MLTTAVFSSLVAVLSLSIALLFATQADKNLKAAPVFKNLHDLALCRRTRGCRPPPLLWFFMFHPRSAPSRRPMRMMGFDWNHVLNGTTPMTLVVMAAVWKQISYNFLFFLAGLQSIPKSVLEAGAIDGAGPCGGSGPSPSAAVADQRSFLLVVNIVYVFSTHSASSMRLTGGGPAGATTTMVYKVYADGRLGGDLGARRRSRWC